jgi:hypothetical protein
MSMAAASSPRERAAEARSGASIACPYCAGDIPFEDFATWPLQPRLTSGVCPGCTRNVTLPIQWLLARPRVPVSDMGPIHD